jgi:hypothetical protein
MERICLEWAAHARSPREQAGLEMMAGNYRAEMVKVRSGSAFADMVQTQENFAMLPIWLKCLTLLVSALGLEPRTP